MDLAGKTPICETQFWANDVFEYKTRTIRLPQAQQETEINRMLSKFHDTWRKTLLGFRDISTKN